MKHEEGKKPAWDGNNEWDPITVTNDGGVIWHNYGKPRMGNQNLTEKATFN